MTISRLALRSAAGFTAVSLGLLACAGLASAGDKPQVNVRPNAGISITGLSLGVGVGSVNLGVNADVNVSINAGVGLDVSDGIDLNATVDADAGVGLGVNALDGAVDADVDVNADIGVDANVGIGDGIRKAATAKIAQRQAKLKIKATPRDAGPQVAVKPTGSVSITGLSLGAGVGSINAVVTGNANVDLNCAAGAGVNGGVTVNASCAGNVGAGVGLVVGGNGEGRKSKAEDIRAAAKAKIAERAAR
ncbi:hypothetical protein [Crossiella cryophila]|uniref:Uncharacterized protein n=1 Tax=Crossiella cryophila TaxID=43355 RepID=A0A7W7C8V3_9PSEU|nr:hypothetical protein [Crossiella cryophila]MBB4675466.1 hypothetical protein [Crossiella cryophila]